ncbi:hypothetical protein [Azospirillum sp.]|uniref:hypothetical protein n=1 Tax=Azospirillum sp. TaxID=34012 RepID=UPI002D754C43|nr:hypothetical protein [Azospirillum sp.]HYD69634.1 hypothetical protein [Azospirillum sp.]
MTKDLRKDLLRQMAEIRGRLDPKLVERAKLAAFGKVPYDRDVAKEAVSRFLDARDDGGAFRRKLEDALRREGEALDLTPDAKPEPKETAHPLKPRRIGRIA